VVLDRTVAPADPPHSPAEPEAPGAVGAALFRLRHADDYIGRRAACKLSASFDGRCLASVIAESIIPRTISARFTEGFVAYLRLFLGDLFHHIAWWIGLGSTFSTYLPERVRGYVGLKPSQRRTTLILAGVLLYLATYQVWSDERRNVDQLVSEKSRFAAERDNWKQQSDSKDAAIRERDALLEKNVSALSDTQTSLATLSNRVLEITKPEPLKIIMAGERLPYYGGNQPHEMIMLAFPNKVLGAVNADVSCDKEIQSARAAMFGHDLWIGGGVHMLDQKGFSVNITSPVWTPIQPLVVYIKFATDLPMVGCRIDQR
jgi:hypothetical protein